MATARTVWFSLIVLCIFYREVICDGAETRIVSGLESQLGDFPYQVSLQMNNRMVCGGTIIDKLHILTAAHCVVGFGPRAFSVVAGSCDLRSQPGTRYQVSGVKIHEKYKSGDGWPHDIALLRLATPIQFNEYVGPSVLPKPGEILKPGQSGVVTGFGQLNTKGQWSTKLYKTQVFVESNHDCQRYYYGDRIRPTNLCTRHPGRITGFCRGDSGGPLNVNGKVVGVVSFSLDYGCAGDSMSPQVYTRVSEYIDWINYYHALDDESRIVNGVAARLGEFPYQVSLQVHGRLHCGGTIIGEKYVLTAAHCITSKNFNFRPNDLSVVVGSIDLSNPYNPGTRYFVSNLRVHESYRHETAGWPHNIAILKLASSIQYNQSVQPARLPKTVDVLQRNQVATVSGHGKFFSTGGLSPILYKTQVHIESNENCQRLYREPISKTNMCIYHVKTTGFCNGDSGGPLIVSGTVVGIVSFSLREGCADRGIFSQVYTRISDYINWIEYWQKYM